MPKLGMKPIRRRQLIDATIAVIGNVGFSDATVSRIAKRAGVSPGIVHHYFEDKHALLEAAMRDLLEQLRTAVAGRLALAETPVQRAEAVIDGNFSAEQFSREAITAWLAFWAHAPHDPALMKLRRINLARAHSNLVSALKWVMPRASVDDAVDGLVALIDGLWLRAALSGGRPDREALRTIARDYLDRLIGDTRDGPSLIKGTTRTGSFAWER